VKSFNKYLGYTALILFIILILSALVSVSYINSNSDLQAIDFNGDFTFSLGSFSERSSNYDTVSITDSQTFSLKEKIIINSTWDEVLFIQEEREDILVECYVEKPDTPLYNVRYSMNETDDSLLINSETNIRNLMTDIDYVNYIKIYIPYDYECDTLDMTMSIGTINNDSIFDNIANLILTSDIGNIDVDITTPKKNLIVSCDLGDVAIKTTAEIDYFECSNDLGDMDIIIDNTVNTFVGSANMGSIDITANDSIDNVDLSSDLGSVTAIFKEPVAALTAETDLGSIDATFYKNDDATTYVENEFGNIYNDFEIVDSDADPDFYFYASLGSITVSKE
jgi:hypothetical protein